MKVRIKFAKYGAVRFIGHLDVMRYFQKAIRRANVDIKYTTGYSPHPIMSFAQPLGLGITSEGEYVDIEVDTTKSGREMVDALNSVMVDGITVLSYRELDEHAKKGMSVIAAADYYIAFRKGYACPFDLIRVWELFIAQEHIMLEKQTKTKKEKMDIRPMIFDYEVATEHLYLQLSCGSAENLKPEAVIRALYQFAGWELEPYALQIHRIELYARDESGAWISLEDMGKEIV